MKKLSLTVLSIVTAISLCACNRKQNTVPTEATPPATVAPSAPTFPSVPDPTMSTNIPDPTVDSNSNRDDMIDPTAGTENGNMYDDSENSPADHSRTRRTH